MSALWIIAVIGFTSVLALSDAAAQDTAEMENRGGIRQSCATATNPDLVCFPNQVGVWKEIDEPTGAQLARLPAGQRLFLSKIQRTASILSRLKVFNPPMGFSAEARVNQCCEWGRSETAPYFGRIWLKFLWFGAGSNGKPMLEPEWSRDAEFLFNPTDFWDGSLQLDLADGRHVAYAPREWGHVNGITLYLNQRDRDNLYIFITKGSRPLWVPLTREQYLIALIRKREAEFAKDEAEMSPEEDAGSRQALAQGRAAMVAPLRSQLRAMSAQERTSQAWVDNPSEISPLVAAGAGRPLVVFNPDYFDRPRPRSDIQLIVVRLTFGGQKLDDIPPPFDDPSQVSRHRLWEFVREVDWQQVAVVMD
jgi:hypothetical protein